jgi:hypothetical protein
MRSLAKHSGTEKGAAGPEIVLPSIAASAMCRAFLLRATALRRGGGDEVGGGAATLAAPGLKTFPDRNGGDRY